MLENLKHGVEKIQKDVKHRKYGCLYCSCTDREKLLVVTPLNDLVNFSIICRDCMKKGINYIEL